MFRPVDVSVEVADTIVFRFSPPLSIMTMFVGNAAGETFWQFIAEEFQDVETSGGMFQSWPIDEAPPEILAILNGMQERADRELAERGPRKPALAAVTYGALPAGYRDECAAAPLAAGEYSVSVLGEQGQGSTTFVI
ncbi:MAG TPA: hypothetical protein VI670_21015 [Thermoanaerobaculia bacterium]